MFSLIYFSDLQPVNQSATILIFGLKKRNIEMNYIDYTFYRVCKFYARVDKAGPDPIYRGIGFVTLLQFLFLLDVVVLISILRDFSAVHEITRVHSLIVILAILGYNLYRYKRKDCLTILNEKWENEDKKVRKKNTLIIWTGNLIIIVSGPILSLYTP